MVTVQASPAAKSASGSSVNVVGPPLAVAACGPLVVQAMVNHDPVTSTASLNVTVTFASRATSVASFAGVVLATVGGLSPPTIVWLPRPPKVSVAKPFHSTVGSKASLPIGSPAWTVSLRRSVLSAVLVRPEPHSVPGSKPTWPMTSRIAVPRRRTTASSPLNQPAPFVWSA